jgi:hypothetical protein
VSLIPAAHLLIVLNVAGTAANALAGGRTSGAPLEARANRVPGRGGNLGDIEEP